MYIYIYIYIYIHRERERERCIHTQSGYDIRERRHLGRELFGQAQTSRR